MLLQTAWKKTLRKSTKVLVRISIAEINGLISQAALQPEQAALQPERKCIKLLLLRTCLVSNP